MNINRHYFHNEGLSLSYLEHLPAQVEDSCPVILLHGFSMNAESNWLEGGWIEKLAAKNRHVIALDARGHGESDKPYDSSYYPANLMVHDSLRLLELKGLAQADFIGFSMGARMATFAALQQPQQVRKLVIGGMGINLVKGLTNSQAIADALLAEDLRSVEGTIPRRFRRIAERQGCDLTALAYCILSSRQQIVPEALVNITAKSLTIAGENDVIAGSVEELKALIPQSTATIIPEINHFNAIYNEPFQTACIDFVCSQKHRV